jgi:hypothetical protein
MVEYGYYPEVIKQQIKEELKRTGIRNESALDDMSKIILHTMENQGMIGHWQELRKAFGSEYATRQVMKELKEKKKV